MRYPSIDVLRTIAICIMVIVHFVENLSGMGHFVPGGFGAPLFSFLVGASYYLWLSGQQAKGRDDGEITKVTIRRGLFLIGVGFLFNVLIWMPEDIFNWDVLTLIGSAIIFLNVVRKMPVSIRVLTCIFIYILSPLLRIASYHSAYWTNSYYDPEMTLPDVLLGYLVNGYFPIFPWLLFSIAGFTVASLYLPDAKRAEGTEPRLLAIGISLIVLAIIAVWTRRLYLEQTTWWAASPASKVIKGWTMFPSSPEYVAGTLGIAITAFVLGHRWIDPSPFFAKESTLATIAGTFSRHSFTVYLLHHVVHITPIWLYCLATGAEFENIWQKVLPATYSWPLSFAFLFGCYFLLRWMDQTKKPGIETLMRWLCD